jgi:GT2 family glycosyltransferase
MSEQVFSVRNAELVKASLLDDLCVVAHPPPWRQLIPFAFWVVDALQPETFVELGTHTGVSYSAFCKAVQKAGGRTACHAIDTWKGDEHSGFYGEEVFEALAAFNTTHFSAFSRLDRLTFDEAAFQFGDKTIDLLHIDGRHDHESVSHDFYTWLPKMTARGIVLFHDTNVRERSFGVWKFWAEISQQYPSFTFMHSNGLGVLAVGRDVPEPIRWLTSRDGDNVAHVAEVRDFFARLGIRVEERLERQLLIEESKFHQDEKRHLQERLSSEVDAHHEEKRLLRSEVTSYQEETGQLQKRLSNEARTHQQETRQLQERLRTEGRAHQDETRRLQEQLDRIKGVLDLEIKERQRLQAANAELDAQRVTGGSEAQRLAAHIEEIRRSTSWRLTGPLRIAGRLSGFSLKRLIRRALGLGQKIARSHAMQRKHDRPVPIGAISSDRAMVLSSSLFDQAWYLARYPDAAASGLAAVDHYLTVGAGRRYNPNPVFDAGYYLDSNPDVASSGSNPLVHYLRYGAAEMRLANPLFDKKFYIDTYPDVLAQGLEPIAHYLQRGVRDNRVTNASNTQLHCWGLDPVREKILKDSIAAFDYHPLISILVPVYNVDPRWLRMAVESVRRQVYRNWQLCLCDDGSTSAATLGYLRSLEGVDERVRVRFQPVNLGIAATSNAALTMADGEFVAMLDHDDELTPDALFEMVRNLNSEPGIDVIYSDEDKIDPSGWLSDPFFKPNWSPELFRGVMYVGHLLVVRRKLMEQIGGFDSRFDKVQDFELMLRLSEHTSRIAHIPKILYHWRKIPGSVSLGLDEKIDIDTLQAGAVQAHLDRLQIQARVEPQSRYRHRVRHLPLPAASHPRVSIVIPTRDAPEHISRCLKSIFTVTRYPNLEVVVVDNGTTDRAALAALAAHKVVRVPYDKPFNFSEANNLGVAAATGDVIVLLNNDTEVVDPAWIETMLLYLQQPDVGAVGLKMLYPDRTVQHAGVVLGMRGTADHVMRGFPEHSDGYSGSLSCTREVSAVTGACLMVRRRDYLAVGGLCTFYRTHYQDVDFCLRLRRGGLRVLVTPHATIIHHESASRGKFYDLVDRALLIDQWEAEIKAGDPYYNPNLSLERGDYSLAYSRMMQ